ncbi:hypothetical protein [Streptomyces sp. MST-110588]|uniref:hypothetical protein n=1 Tax=Streptomyces sp. MST-110588 TaxID=2833628 RepID=UPI001F5D6C2B|nr:hypothetical protein [Streptomyces sp. MST-110588]UNO38387.1 hypothetical protein KGS77_00390 [Streptomyces sp. MST-110588]
MGRSKPGKQRRPRQAASYSLHQLQPPGDLYGEWIRVPSDTDLSHMRADPRLSRDSRDVMERLVAIAPHYGGEAPVAAVVLDTAIDKGRLGVLDGPDGGRIVSLAQAAELVGADPATARAGIHRLHALGTFLVEEHQNVPFMRFVAKRPASPGDQWFFVGEEETAGLPRAEN